MQKYKSNITTTSGAAVRGVPVLVIDEDGNNAALFLDRAGTVPAQNPLTTGQDGVFYFYAVNGRYSLRTTVDGVTITDDDVVLMMDPEEITVAGPIAEAVAAAQAAAIAAEFAVKDSGIPDLVAAAQNAVVDSNNAVTQANSAANNAALSKTGADSARDAAVIAKNAAEAALDSFDDRYLGAKASAPTTDNDGGALLTGALYWDTALPGMRSWNGAAWVTLPAATAASMGNTPAGSIAATTVQAAINELDAEKVAASVELPDGTDLNTVVKSGFYRLSAVVNGPPGDISYGQMIVSRGMDTIAQIAFSYGTGIVYTRSGNPTDVGGVGAWTPWRVLLDSSNYNVYSPNLTGGGASGTWPISVAGSATTLTTARTINGVSFNGSANISIAAAAVPNTPAGSIAATTVQAAINELDTEKFGRNTIIGTVSQSAGVPTGSVIERGSNANGEYVRFADGTQICTRRIPVGGSPEITLAAGSLYRSADDILWTYPAAFIGQPSIGGFVTGGVALTWLGLGSEGSGTTTASFVAFATVATGAKTGTAMHAVGRWF